MKKTTFYTLIRTKDGEKIAQEKTGYTFSNYGYTFNLYKIHSNWCVLEASTGLKVCQARTLKEAPAKVSEYIDVLKSFFSNIGEQTKEAIKIIADATNKAQAVDGEAEKPEPTETEKKTTPASARSPKAFTKKRFYISLRNAKKETKIEEVQGYAFICEDRTLYTYKSKITKVWYIVEPSTGMAFGNFYTSNKLKDIPALAKNFFEEYGSRFDSMIEKFSDCAEAIRKANGETATKEETKTEKPAKNVIKRDTTILSGTLLIDTAYSAKGDVVDVFKDRTGWTGVNRRTGKIALFPSSFLRNGEVFRIDAQRPEPTTENITHLIDAGKDEEAKKELFTLLVVSGERAIAETNRAHGEILETTETKDLLEKIANEAEKTTAAYFAPAKDADTITTDTETPAISAGTVRTEKTKPCTPCTMTAARRKWYNICGNVYRSGTEPNHGASLVKSIIRRFEYRTLTSMHRTEKRGYMSATRSHKAICTRAETAPGRTQNRTRSRTNCEVTARGSPENIASLQVLILAS